MSTTELVSTYVEERRAHPNSFGVASVIPQSPQVHLDDGTKAGLHRVMAENSKEAT